MVEFSTGAVHASNGHTNTQKSGSLYLGFDAKLNRFLFIKGNQEFYGDGRLLRILGQSGKKSFLREVRCTKESPVKVLSTGEGFDCIGAKSGQRYRFQGVLTLQHAKSSKDKPQSSQAGKVRDVQSKAPYMTAVGSQTSPPPVAAEHLARPIVEVDLVPPDAIQMTANTSPSAHSTALPAENLKLPLRARYANYAVELERIGLARAAGLDPDVRMEFISLFLNESRANIYRKLKLGQFPKPVKRGRGSFWPMSTIEAYKAGKTPEAVHA